MAFAVSLEFGNETPNKIHHAMVVKQFSIEINKFPHSFVKFMKH